jgi:predicted RNase H-like nuclease (RuvC/YqgF family)
VSVAKEHADRSVQQKDKAMAALTKQTEQQSITIGSLETKCSFLQEQVSQLQQQLELERNNAQQSAAVTKDVERSHQVLREHLATQRAEHEVHCRHTWIGDHDS